MKSKLIPAILVALMICMALPVYAYASNETAGSTTVTYTYEPDYFVNIPETVSLNTNQEFTFSAKCTGIGPTKKLLVTVDDSRTFDSDGKFYLYKDKNLGSEEKMLCRIFKHDYNPSGSSMTEVWGLKETLTVAEFTNQSNAPSRYGALRFEHMLQNQSYGIYSGTIYFKIELADS